MSIPTPSLLTVLLLALAFGSTVAPAAEPTTALPHPEAAGVKRFAVTLLSSFEPIPEKLLPKDVPRNVYRTKSTIFGRTIHFARVGFYATAGEAEAAKAKLLSRYPAAFVTEISGPEYRQATAGRTPIHSPAPVLPPAEIPQVIAPQPPAAGEVFVVTLATGTGALPKLPGTIPESLRGNRFYTADIVRDGQTTHTLNLGFFSTPSEANRARRLLTDLFPNARTRVISAAERDASLKTALVLAPPPPPEIPSAPASTNVAVPQPSVSPRVPTTAAGPASLETEALTLIDRARDALTRGQNIVAIQTLTKLLQLPPNRQSQEAQELVGVAEERVGNRTRARQEFQLYLKLYPEGPGADRVRQRLAALNVPTEKSDLKTARRRGVDVTTVYGGLSQYYYYGKSKIDTTTQPVLGPTQNQSTLTLTDQSALISNLDINARVRRGDWDNRFVIRENHVWNFIDGQENRNRLYSAYSDTRNKAWDTGLRLGRQPGNVGGALNRFDGAAINYGFLPKFRINLVAGQPVEYVSINSDKWFWGASMDFGTFAEHWSGSIYYNKQMVDDVIDREAIGTELRYFDPELNAFTLLDYDSGFGELNIGTLQVTKLFGPKINLNALVDHRKAPILTLSNAVIGETNTSIQSQLQALSEEQLRRQATDRTPESNLYSAGINLNVTTKWQIGGDVKLYNLTGTPASGPLPATQGSGNILVYTLQGIGTSLLSKRDITVLSLSYLNSPTFSGESLSISNRTVLFDNWTLDFAIRYYDQEDQSSTTLTRWNPTIRLGYRWRNSITLEVEYGLENTVTESTTTIDESRRNYYSLGYRWDF